MIAINILLLRLLYIFQREYVKGKNISTLSTCDDVEKEISFILLSYALFFYLDCILNSMQFIRSALTWIKMEKHFIYLFRFFFLFMYVMKKKGFRPVVVGVERIVEYVRICYLFQFLCYSNIAFKQFLKIWFTTNWHLTDFWVIKQLLSFSKTTHAEKS